MGPLYDVCVIQGIEVDAGQGNTKHSGINQKIWANPKI